MIYKGLIPPDPTHPHLFGDFLYMTDQNFISVLRYLIVILVKYMKLQILENVNIQSTAGRVAKYM